MPRISEGRRAAQRAKIVSALLESVMEKGIADTSMADVIKRSGLSVGAIYGYFPGKDEILVAAAREVMKDRAQDFVAISGLDPVPSPSQAVRQIAGTLPGGTRNARAVLQIWGQAVTHDAINLWTNEIIGRLLDAGAVYLQAWFTQEGRRDPVGSARRSAPALLGLVQGYIAQSALHGDIDLDDYVAGIDTLFGLEE